MSTDTTNEETPHGNVGNKHAAKPKKERLEETRTFRFKASEIAAMKRACVARKQNGKTMPLRLFVRLACCRESGHELPDMDPVEW